MNTVKLYKSWVAYSTITRREIRRFTRIWMQTIIPPIVSTSLYFLIFGKLIGERVGLVDGVSYIEYIAPGLIMMAILTNSYSNSSSSFFSTKYHKNIEEQLVSSMHDRYIVLGYVTGGALRGLCVGLIVSIVSMLFVQFEIKHLFLTTLVAVLTATTFAFGGFINGLLARNYDDVTLIPNFVLTPLTYLGGIFYSTSMLSPFWEKVAYVNPIFYVISGFRYAMLGVSNISFILTLIILISAIVTLYIYSVRLMKYSSSLRS